MPAKKNKISLKRKITLGILIFLLALPLFARPALAFESKGGQPQFEEAIKSDEMNLQSFVNETIKAVMGSFIHFIIGPLGSGCSISEPEKCLVKTDGQFYGLVPASSLLIGAFYQSPPASGIKYFAGLGERIGITRSVYAEEKNFSTFQAMSFIQPIWTVFRNISYVLFVLILVAMGFAIMFRVKISPQAVITLQSALPKIVIALVLITFSYAIVGLILDAGMFLNSTISSIFVGIFEERFKNSWVFTLFERISAMLTPEETHEMVRPFADAFVYGGLASTALFIAILGASVFTPSILIGLIIAVLLLIAYFRTIWVLLKAFAIIILNIIFAPLRILIGVIPGSSGIGDWLKDVAANVAILPTMLVMYFLGNYLIIEGITRPITILLEGASDIGIYWVFWLFSALVIPLIGIIVLLFIPKAADIIQSAITKKPFQYGTAIGEAMKPIVIPGRIGLEYGKTWATGYAKEKGAMVARGRLTKETEPLPKEEKPPAG